MNRALRRLIKGKKTDLPPTPATPEPRDMEAINKEYSLLCGFLGQAQYKLKVAEASVNDFLNQVAEIDKEARARKELDEKTAAAKLSEVTNEQA